MTNHATATAMPHTLAQAAEATGKSRSTILRAIQTGKLSATRDDGTQGWLIEPAELHRIYPPVANDEAADAPRTRPATATLEREIELLREMMGGKDEVISDLRTRLDEAMNALRTEGEERRKLMAIITDQRPEKQEPPPAKRRWRLWGRG
jgi:excisionase family DNA binding protein